MESEGKAVATNSKRKVMWILFIIVLAILIWQGAALLRGSSSSSTPTPVTPPSKIPALPTVATSTVTTAPAPTAASAAPAFNPVGDLQTPEQKKYLEMLGEYQLLQIQQRIEEAKLAIAQSEANMMKLSAPPPVTVVNSNLQEQPVAEANYPKASAPSLQYIGRVNQGKWSAIINVDGSYQEAMEGSQLSNGAIVKKITPHSVILDEGGELSTLSL